ncbi:lamin tail domain-containing protein [Luteolibacter sp. SL250]|uniref:lamin tail domain-containing protein n=1 Tax=Luteolibacter sp. SL250 TaxID=2995170 RepID=UPI00226EA92E|nr:lamin tail domain-containing protein [Luteolibacter sp. SL250]WAC19453.1 lamin tail domain-containing protein [Luteolibacter sp. SL250]
MATAAPVAIPFTENFDSGSSVFSGGSGWTHTGGKYRGAISGNGTSSGSSVEAPAFPDGFRMETSISGVTGTGGTNSCGFGFLGAAAGFSGTSPYYLVDVRPATSRLRLVQVGTTNVFFINNEALAFTLDPATPFKLSVEGTYDGPVLRLRIIVSQNANQSIHAFDDDTPLTGSFFGFRVRSEGTSATIGADFDDFSLRGYSLVDFTGAPAAYARSGSPYSSTFGATSTSGGTVGFSPVELPGWLSLTDNHNGTATVSGTPPAGLTGSFLMKVWADDSNGAPAVQEFPLKLLGISGVMISEFVASNNGALEDEDGDDSDWLEIFNADPDPVDLGGWKLRDDKTSWTIPAGTVLPPFGHLVVFASDKNRTGPELHANFKLSADAGGQLALVRPDNSIASEYTNYPAQRKGASYGVWGDYQSRGYLSPPTPGAANPAEGYVSFAANPAFSMQRGFFTSPQSLTLEAPLAGASISYTLDGSLPTATNGTLITAADASAFPSGTISIPTSSVVRAVAFKAGYLPSPAVTHTYLFPDDLVTQSANGLPPEGWPTNSVNGQMLDYGMDPEVINSPAKAEELKAALRSLPTFSLVTDRKHFFDPLTGIYVNAYGREKEWERPTSMEMIRPDGTSAFQIDCGMRMRGGVSRDDSNPKHSFHFYFRSEYGEGKLNYPLFDGDGAAEFDRIDLRTTQGSKSWHTSGSTAANYMQDEWSRATQGAMGHPHARSRYVHLYINGQYWGIYATQERADNAWAASYFGGEKEEYDIIKTYTLPHRVEAADGDAVAWTQLFNAATAGFSSDAAYYAVQGRNPDGTPSATLKPLVEIDNLIDYMILNMFASNTDGPVNPGDKNVPKNFFCFRPRDGSAGFRFVAHDFEDTFGGTDVTGHLTTDGKHPVAGATLVYFNPRWLHLQLVQNPNYLRRFGDRVQRNLFGSGALTASASTARWTAMRAVLAPAMLAESARWGDSYGETRGTAGYVPRTVANWESGCNVFFNPTNSSGTLVSRPNSFITLLRGTSRGYALFPSTDVTAPVFSLSGGVVPPGSSLTITGPASTGIFYTLDGTDPSGGTAVAYTGSIPLDSASVMVKARVRHNTTGEWSTLTEATFTHPPVPAAPGNLYFSELHYNPDDGLDTRDFIEVHNPSSSIVDLTGVRITTGITFAFPSVLLQPGARIVAVKNLGVFRALYGQIPKVAGVWDGNLANSGETIELRAADNSIIESLTYADVPPWPTSPDGDGPSLVRIHHTLQADSAYSWRASSAFHGTPDAPDAASFASWLSSHQFASAASPAPGGMKALLHYATATPPADQPTAPLITRGAGTDSITLRRPFAAVDAVRFFIEQSSDLTNWPVSIEIDSAAATILNRNVDSGGIETLTVRLPTTAPGTFYRLRYLTR